MILTEREKWLMQRAWDTSFTYCGPMEHWLEGRTESGMSIMHDHLAEYAPKSESIVKQVDPDNLPDFGVLILDQKSELYSTGLFIENQRVVGFLNSKHEINHYIEIKDIIKLLEDSK